MSYPNTPGEGIATETPVVYTVVIDPTNARTIVADYALWVDADNRVRREIASRLNGRGGSVTMTSPGSCRVYRVSVR